MKRRTEATWRSPAVGIRARSAELLLAFVLLIRGSQGLLDRLDLNWLALVADLLSIVVGLLVSTDLLRRLGRVTLAGGLALAYLAMCVSYAGVMSLSSPLAAVYGLRAMTLQVATGILVIAVVAITHGAPFLRRALLLVVLANCIAALRQAISGLSAAELQQLVDSGSTYTVGTQTRLLGLQPSGQDLALLTTAAAVWGLYQVLRHGFRSAGALTLAVTLASSLVAILTLQRSVLVGAALALGVATIALGIRHLRSAGASRLGGRLLIFAGLASSIGVAIAIAAPAQFQEATNRIFSFGALGADTSWQTRLDTTIPVALRLIAEAPFGHGMGTSGSVGARYSERNPLADYPLGGIAADNGYFFVALQVGLVGMAIFAAMLVAWAIEGSLFGDCRTDRGAAAVVIVFLLGSMISGSFWGLASTMSLVLAFAALPGQEATQQLLRMANESTSANPPIPRKYPQTLIRRRG